MADNHAHDDYVRGSMEISEQSSTYALFLGMAKYGSLAIVALLTFLTLWFMPAGNFFIGAGAAVVLMVAGVFFLRSPKKH
jgi:hypothetical protein